MSSINLRVDDSEKRQGRYPQCPSFGSLDSLFFVFLNIASRMVSQRISYNEREHTAYVLLFTFSIGKD
jgi:hypothetical protein